MLIFDITIFHIFHTNKTFATVLFEIYMLAFLLHIFLIRYFSLYLASNPEWPSYLQL